MSFFDRSFGSMIAPLKNGSKNGASTNKLIEKDDTKRCYTGI